MKLQLTAEQAAEIEPHMRIGFALLGRVTRRQFDGTNSDTCGALMIEIGPVPESSLPSLRDAIRAAAKPARRRTRRGLEA